MNYTLEVIPVPVADLDRAKNFYMAQAGFVLDVDYAPNPDFRLIQLTPPGSGCSIQLEVGTGRHTGLCLVVTDLVRAGRELGDRGVTVDNIRHKASLPDWQGDWAPGVDPERRDLASFADFHDPDGNAWVLQERGFSGS
ncbi:glyoxalase [Actinoplanes sp. NPDC051411]|uniref:glyoxalase n=1 Tax=Actinoplanes sp. NPDC051411 TaxID=3155522 RepID=UPI0034393B0F